MPISAANPAIARNALTATPDGRKSHRKPLRYIPCVKRSAPSHPIRIVLANSRSLSLPPDAGSRRRWISGGSWTLRGSSIPLIRSISTSPATAAASMAPSDVRRSTISSSTVRDPSMSGISSPSHTSSSKNSSCSGVEIKAKSSACASSKILTSTPAATSGRQARKSSASSTASQTPPSESSGASTSSAPSRSSSTSRPAAGGRPSAVATARSTRGRARWCRFCRTQSTPRTAAANTNAAMTMYLTRQASLRPAGRILPRAPGRTQPLAGSLRACGSTSSRSSRTCSRARSRRPCSARRSPPTCSTSGSTTSARSPRTGTGRVDDEAFGGGPGMVLKPEPVFAAVESLDPDRGRVLAMSPAGRRLDQPLVRALAAEPHLTIICGRYEGFDERIIEGVPAEEVSIGDYVLSGGELPALVLIEAVTRLVPGGHRGRRLARAGFVQRAGAPGPPALHAARRVPRDARSRRSCARATTRGSRPGAGRRPSRRRAATGPTSAADPGGRAEAHWYTRRPLP